MRRIFNHDFLTTNQSLALQYSISKLLVALLLLSLQPSVSLAQANPFADVPASDTSDQMPTDSATPKAATRIANPFDEIPRETDQQDAAVSADPPPVTGMEMTHEVSEPLTAKTIDVTDAPQKTEPNNSAAPNSAEKPQSRPVNVANSSSSTGWSGWLFNNWYWPVAALLLTLLGWFFLKGKSAKNDLGRPRVKTTGSFKKSDRFQENGEGSSKLKGITSELASVDGESEELVVGDSSDIFDFEEESNGELTENKSSSIAVAATELADGEASIEESDDDFLDLMMGESEENEVEKVVEAPVGITDSPLQEVGQPDPSEAADDDDFLELMMSETEETEVTDFEDSQEVASSLLQESDLKVDQSLQEETLDEEEDAFLDLLLDEDEDSSLLNNVSPDLGSSAESTDIADPLETAESVALDDESDEFMFDFEEDTPTETESVETVGEELASKVEEFVPSGTDDQPTPTGGVSFLENEDVAIDADDVSDVEGIELGDQQLTTVGGVAAAAGGIAAGLGALLAAKGASDSAQPDEDAASGELREQLAQALEKQQRNAAEIGAQQTEINALKAKLERATAPAEEVDRLKTELQNLKEAQLDSTEAKDKLQQHAGDLEGKLEDAEKKASEAEAKLTAAQSSVAALEKEKKEIATELEKISDGSEEIEKLEAKLTAAESSIAALEKEKKEIATELESSSDGSEEIEKLEAEISALKSQAEETLTRNEQLQLEAKELRNEASELKKVNERAVSDSGIESGSLMATAQSEDVARITDGDDSSQLQQLKAQYKSELALRKETEAMLLEAEQQRTDVAIALRDLRKQAKSQGGTNATEEVDELKKELAESKSANEELSQQLDKFREKLEQEHDVSKELAGKLSAAQEDVSAVTVLEGEWTQKLGALESEIEAKGKESSRLTDELSAAKKSLDEFKEKVTEVKAKEEEHQAVLAKQETLLLESKSNLESMIAEKSELEVSLGELKEKAGTFSYAQL